MVEGSEDPNIFSMWIAEGVVRIFSFLSLFSSLSLSLSLWSGDLSVSFCVIIEAFGGSQIAGHSFFNWSSPQLTERRSNMIQGFQPDLGWLLAQLLHVFDGKFCMLSSLT